ncbi:14911_t:CDS:2, partial [Funneliformis geosporum]
MVNYKCTFCKRIFSSRLGYSQHVNICDQSISDENLPPPVEELLLSDNHSSNFENIISEDSIINQDILEPESDVNVNYPNEAYEDFMTL